MTTDFPEPVSPKKKVAAVAEPTMAEVLARMADIMAEQARANSRQDERLSREDLSTVEARKMGRGVGATGAFENRLPPDISHYNPLGERDHPRPDLLCQTVWVGFKMTKEAATREEIELLNACPPGEYHIKKADESVIDFTVTVRTNRAGKPELKTFHFPCKSIEDRHNHLPMANYLKQAIAQAEQLKEAQ